MTMMIVEQTMNELIELPHAVNTEECTQPGENRKCAHNTPDARHDVVGALLTSTVSGVFKLMI